MPGGVYLLCAVTSCVCSILLFRGYRRSGVKLLFWSALCFLGLTIDNALLYVDVIVMPEIDLSVWRNLPGLLALVALLYGLVWDSK
jgi:uncharacterized protein DUF5985